MTNCTALTQAKGPLLMEVDSVATGVRWCLAFLGCMKAMVQRPAVALDIDGTVIKNTSEGSRCVLHFRSLVEACRTADVAVFFITARPESAREHTERQLARCGFRYEKLFLQPPRQEYSRYKERARQSIVESGYGLLLSIGDQFADVNRKELNLADDKFYIGQFGDTLGGWAVKLPSEFT